MAKREDQNKQDPLWIAHTELAASPGHPFYEKLNELLDGERFDAFVEALSAGFYAPQFGRPSLLPGITPISPLDVLDLILLHRRDNAFMLHTWTL